MGAFLLLGVAVFAVWGGALPRTPITNGFKHIKTNQYEQQKRKSP
jgi:hypothetical protein